MNRCNHPGTPTTSSFRSKVSRGVQTNEYCPKCKAFIGCSFLEDDPPPEQPQQRRDRRPRPQQDRRPQ